MRLMAQTSGSPFLILCIFGARVWGPCRMDTITHHTPWRPNNDNVNDWARMRVCVWRFALVSADIAAGWDHA